MQLNVDSGIRRKYFSDTEFYSKFIKIAIPVTLQNFLSSSLNLTNNILVGQLGDASVAAVGLANQVFFILMVVLAGIGGGVSLYISQFWGSEKYDRIRKVVSLSLIITLAASLIFFIPSFLIPRQLLLLFSNDTGVIAQGIAYLRPVSFSYFLMATSMCFSSALRSTGNVKLPLFANMVSTFVNTALNFVLIFGMYGLPAMGVAGSGTATLIARIAENAILFASIYTGNSIVAVKLKDMFHIPADLVKRFFSTSGELITKDVVWALGTSIYMVVYARMSTEAVASVNIMSTIRNLAFVFFGGVSNACLIMVGNKIGSNEKDTAYKYAGRFLKITLVISAVVGTLLILARHLALSPYKVSDTVLSYASGLMIVNAIMLVPTSFASLGITGVMRSGGDIRYSIAVDFTAVWLIGLPLAWIGGMVLHLSIVWVLLLVNLQEVFKSIIVIRRYRSGKWINNMVGDI